MTTSTTQTNGKFIKERFGYHGGYLTYQATMVHGVNPHTGEAYSHPDYSKAIFIARFKYAMTRSKTSYLNFLIKNFTIEQFTALTAANEKALREGRYTDRVDYMEDAGWFPVHIVKMLKQGGYPKSREGVRQMIKDQSEAAKIREAASSQPMTMTIV